jgi:hypothetical protein
MGYHRSKTANIRGFYLAHNTLLGLNEQLAINSTVKTTYVEHPKAIEVVAILDMTA